jgi:diaminohydroxyphosphoribosylaminopyrimidine deaminase/5-amino-6-(5-phosphoribosylamino)uracil reductase
VGAGISRVVVGATDPDTRVAGSGIQRLRTAGLDVVTGVADDAVIAADPGYFHQRRTGRPRVTLKLAATLDGQVAAADGTSQWITGSEARGEVHRLRSAVDAVAVGAGTVLADDPQLNVRLDSYGGPQPRPVVVAGTRAIPDDRRVLARSPLIYSPRPIDMPRTAEIVEIAGDSRVDLAGLLKDLGARGILSLLVEGGPTLAASFAGSGLVDEYVLYLGQCFGLGVGRPMFDGLFATIGAARSVSIIDVAQIGGDVRIRAIPEESSR